MRIVVDNQERITIIIYELTHVPQSFLNKVFFFSSPILCALGAHLMEGERENVHMCH